MVKTIQDFSPYPEERPWGSFTKFVDDDCVVTYGEKHYVEVGLEPVVMLEISRGESDEGDIVRFEDRYGRVLAD